MNLPSPLPAQTLGLVCRVCGAMALPVRRGRALDLDIEYFECPECRYVQTETPYWLGRAYGSAINDSDTGIIARNLANARIVLGTLWLLDALDSTVVDYAGGYGVLVRLLRDDGIDALWSDAFCENLLARGFEHAGQPGGLVTAFEAFEHFVDPSAELEKMLAVAPNVLLSTLLIPSPVPADWWYYGAEHGQHVGLYRAATLELLARRHGKVLVTDGASYHLITDRPVSRMRWRLLLRANRLAAFWTRRRLTSKTWSDHLAASPGAVDRG